MKIWKAALLLGIVGLSGHLAYRHVSFTPGYCREQKRYIGDAEYLMATIAITYRDMNTESTNYPSGEKRKRKDFAARYKNWDFDPKNPNCCEVKLMEPQSIDDRIFGRQEVWVFLNPRTHTRRGDVGDHRLIFRWDVCGNLISGIGLPSRRYPFITTKDIGGHHRR